MWNNKKRDYPWLVSNEKNLGCSICIEVSSLGCYADKSIHIAKEWKSISVTPTGTNKEKQLMSLRNKIKRHKESIGHVQAERIKQHASKEVIESNILRMSEKQFIATNRVFCIAYKIGKMGHPFSDMPVECDVHILNGIDIGTTLQSDKSFQAIIDHIGQEMRSKIRKMIINDDTKVSVIIDESTSISKKSALIIYIKVCLPEPTTIFLDIVELVDGQGADSIFNSLMKCLDKHGFTLEVLIEKLICFASDGASVMLGSNSGVAARVQHAIPNVIVWHCMNHRLELAVGDTIEEVSGTNHFKVVFDKLYCLYHTSSKNKRELEECCKELASTIYTIDRILGTRWVASSFHTVKVVWDLYAPLYDHLTQASEDRSRSSTERSSFKGMATRIFSNNFVLNLGAMYDSLEELASLSKDLQERNVMLPRAHNLVQRQIRVFTSMVDHPGVYYKEAEAAVLVEKKFKGVPLNSRKCDVVIHHGQFMRSLATNLEKRLMAFKSKVIECN